jgi:hypothetical protein
LLALPAEQQIEWVHFFVPVPTDEVDELALEFDAGRLLVDQFVERGWLGKEARDLIVELDAFLDQKSGNVDVGFWTFDGLREHPDWKKIRSMAFDVLCQI